MRSSGFKGSHSRLGGLFRVGKVEAAIGLDFEGKRLTKDILCLLFIQRAELAFPVSCHS